MSQKLNEHILNLRMHFTESIHSKFSPSGFGQNISSQMFVNMDQMAVFFEPKQNRITQFQGENPISLKRLEVILEE